MQLEVRTAADWVVITPLEKRIDTHVATVFRSALIEQIELGHHNVLVDLAHVEFIDSSGLGALVSALKRIGRDGRLKVCSPTEGVRTMFELTRLNRVIEITEAM